MSLACDENNLEVNRRQNFMIKGGKKIDLAKDDITLFDTRCVMCV